MQKKYYISNILFNVTSEIELDEYEGERKFQHPSITVDHIYQVQILLADEITVPVNNPIQIDSCRVWFIHHESSAEELRIFPYGNISDSAIESSLSGNQITIKILRDIWNINMHTFRIWSYMFLERILLKHDALILHSASIIYKEKAILFTAPSETGKTTQTDIWHRNDPEVKDLNGDRTILQKTGKGWIACGIPISGTSTRCEQAALPIAAIALVNRASVDYISYLNIIQKIQFLYGQITVFSALEEDAQKALDLLENLIDQVKILQLNCTMNDSAYKVLLEEISE